MTARATIGKWGNSRAIRISKDELERLGLKDGDEVEYELRPVRSTWDVSMLPVFGGKPVTLEQARREWAEARSRELGAGHARR